MQIMHALYVKITSIQTHDHDFIIIMVLHESQHQTSFIKKQVKKSGVIALKKNTKVSIFLLLMKFQHEADVVEV